MGNKAIPLSIGYDLKTILENVECYPDNPNYSAHQSKLEDLIAASLDHIHPIGYLVRDARDRHLPVSSLSTIYCLVTLGPWVDQQIKTYFSEHDYLEGMMLNALSDQILYEATNALYAQVKAEVENEGQFLTIRFEPGNTEVPIQVQKEIYDKMMANYDLDLTLTEGYMFSPTKTLAYFYGIETEDCSLGIDHDCSACQSITCKNRRYIITVHMQNEIKLVQGKKGENLLEVLRRHNIEVQAPCNGKRICGKCKVHAPKHTYELEATEARFLSIDEQNNSVILACFHPLDRNLDIWMGDGDLDHKIIVDYAPIRINAPKYSQQEAHDSVSKLGIAIDIGTTTVVVSLVDLVSHEILGIEKVLNPQKAYGADIISRILYTTEHPDHPLGTLIRESLKKSMMVLMERSGYGFDSLEAIVVSGNTTMIYLLMNFNPEKLAVSPFTTLDMGLYTGSSETLWDLPSPCQVTLLPWLSAYVGGDIISGLYATELKDQKETILFIDIGTNGEIVLKTDQGFICASTAAGPAFEGVNIKCGMGSTTGAICEILEDDTKASLVVIGGGEPKGICGSALIDAIAIMLKKGLIEASGYLEAPYLFHESIGIYPADVRQVQLAKSAIAAGIEVLLDAAGLTYNQVDHVYIAGGFGSHLTIKNAVTIGLIPKALEDKVVVVGNTSLAGSVRYLLEAKGQEAVDTILNLCDYLELSTSMKFNEVYVEHMMFGGLS